MGISEPKPLNEIFSAPAIQTKIDLKSTKFENAGGVKIFRENQVHVNEAWEKVEAAKKVTQESGREKGIKSFEKKGKMLPNDMIEAMVDPGSFVQLSALAGYNLFQDDIDPTKKLAGSGMITGLAQVNGVDTMLILNDGTLKGGSANPATIKQHIRALTIAKQNHLPVIRIVDSSGVFLPMQEDIYSGTEGYAKIFALMSDIRAMGLPIITGVTGACIAGGAYDPIESSYVIMTDNGFISLASPATIKHVTKSEEPAPNAYKIGGGAVQETTGVIDVRVKNDAEMIEKIKDQVTLHNYPGFANVPARVSIPEAPLYDTKEIAGIINFGKNEDRPYDVHEIIARLVDGSKFEEYRPTQKEYKRTMQSTICCGYAYVDGHPVGIVASNGKVILPPGADKAGAFIQDCASKRRPLIFLHDVKGFDIGEVAEKSGIGISGRRMLDAVRQAKVPKISLLMHDSQGAGNYAMCGQGLDPHFIFSGPNTKMVVMEPSTLSGTMKNVLARGGTLSKEDERHILNLQNEIQAQMHITRTSAKGFDDGVVHPDEWRAMLARTLGIALRAPVEESHITPSR